MDRDTALGAYRAALRACDPERAVAGVVRHDGTTLAVGPHVFRDASPSSLVVVAIGKAAPEMVRGLASVVVPMRGIVVTDRAAEGPLDVVVSEHPIPGPRSFAAGARMLDVVRASSPDDVIVFLVSGGGSALAEVPAPGVGQEELIEASRLLLRSGAPIAEVNAVRVAMSRIKGGGLAAAAGTRRHVTIIVSDVVSGGPEVVASGPSIRSDVGLLALDVIDRHGLSGSMPSSVIDAATRWMPQSAEETPVTVVVSPRQAGQAAATHLEGEAASGAPGIGRVILLDAPLVGDPLAAVERMMSELEKRSDQVTVVAIGETTPVVVGDAVGGRNQHAALIAADRIAGTDVVFAAMATDGRDGPTEAMGAIVDGASTARMRAHGVDPRSALDRFDASSALLASGDLVPRWTTGTNVADLWVVGRGPVEPSGAQLSKSVRNARMAAS